jgi:ribosome-associated protein
VSIVVHVFHPTLREYYQLERLWSDAPTLSTDLAEVER